MDVIVTILELRPLKRKDHKRDKTFRRQHCSSSYLWPLSKTWSEKTLNDLVGQRATQEDRTELVLIYDLSPGYIYGHGKKKLWDEATQEDRTEAVLIYHHCANIFYTTTSYLLSLGFSFTAFITAQQNSFLQIKAQQNSFLQITAQQKYYQRVSLVIDLIWELGRKKS